MVFTAIRWHDMNVDHVGRYVRNPRVAGWKKVLGLLAVVYALAPIDAIPDVVPLLGWLDDLGVLTVAFGLIARDMAQHAKRATVKAPADEVIEGVATVR
jgi:uncharacterized membrane protein YkvA (DUF1232 family)